MWAAAVVEEGFLMGTVVEKERFVMKSGTKVRTEKREDSVFGFDLAGQHALEFREADEALE